jgi:hypothetical protein
MSIHGTFTAFGAAAKAIAAGEAKAHALWVILTDERQRDGLALKPMPWEGTGEYQHVTYADGRDGFVRVQPGERSLPIGPRVAKATPSDTHEVG